MSSDPRPSRRYQHVYAILRYESDADGREPIEFRVTVKKVVADPDHADQEVKRLNELNGGKGSYYFRQLTRFEDVPAGAQELSSARATARE